MRTWILLKVAFQYQLNLNMLQLNFFISNLTEFGLISYIVFIVISLSLVEDEDVIEIVPHIVLATGVRNM